MLTIVHVSIVTSVLMCACRDRSQPPAQMTEDDALRWILDVLVSYEAKTPGHHYGEPIRRLRQLLCSKGPCDGKLDATASRELIGELALTFARSSSDEVRAIATGMACGLCSEEAIKCHCEGHACTAADFAPRHSQHNTKLRCNVTEVDGKPYPWGAAVRSLP